MTLKDKAISDVTNCRKADGIYQSLLSGLTILQFVKARTAYCLKYHALGCSECNSLIQAANEIISCGIADVADTFRKCFPSVKYSSYNAKRRFLQLPVVIFEISRQGKGSQRLCMIEQQTGVNYVTFVSLFHKLIPSGVTAGGINKATLDGLCNLASTESDKKLIKYAACAARNLSAEKASRDYGISNYGKLRTEVEEALQKACEIRNEVMEIAAVEERAFLRTLGIDVSSSESEPDDSSTTCEWDSEQSESDESEQSDPEDVHNTRPTVPSEEYADANSIDSPGIQGNVINPEDTVKKASPDKTQSDLNGNTEGFHDASLQLDPDSGLNKEAQQSLVFTPTHDHLALMLRESNLNWFVFVDELMLLLRQYNTSVIEQVLLDFAHDIAFMDFTVEEERLIEQSRQAFLARSRQQPLGCQDNSVVTDSESDNPEEWLSVKKLNSPKGIEMIKKQRSILRSRTKRRVAKEIASKCLLKRKIPKRVSSILKEFPNIGQDIEEYVRSRRCGADAWRRTGVVTFDGNRKRGPKASYKRIHEHLKKKYQTNKISYGTVVQLCTIRNKRKLSAKRYKGIAKVTCRRSRKGFSIKYNPDAHWSCAFYKSLDVLQLADARNKVLINRDDQAGFRLDTTYTHKGRGVLSEEMETTTRVDYVNTYSSILQTTSYHIMESNTTPQACAGIVKAQYVYPKNPAQHAADLRMLENHPEFLEHLKDKEFDCIRCDGAHDENPAGLETQFMWTERHMASSKTCTIVTTRHSGGSYLNRVELQNGCLALAHSHLFIPSTLNGNNYNEKGLDPVKLRGNLDAAADVYINRVDGAPCGDTPIRLLKGANDEYASYLQERRPDLLTFLSGSKKEKEQLKSSKPTQFQYFSEIWDVRNNHMVKNAGDKYVFHLVPCFKEGCIHPLCKKGKPQNEPLWSENSLSISLLPLPVPDQSRPWGGSCEKCVGFCAGHFLPPRQCFEHIKRHGMQDCAVPPSIVLSKAFEDANRRDLELETVIPDLAKATLLTTEEVKMWFDHLQLVKDRRKEGAKKAKDTRAKKKGM